MGKTTSWILGIIIVGLIGYGVYFYGTTADSSTSNSGESEEVVIKDGWKEFVSTKSGFAFQYPLEATWFDGPTELVSVSEVKMSEDVATVIPTIFVGDTKNLFLERKTKPLEQSVVNFLREEHDVVCTDCPQLGNFTSKINPKDTTEFVVVWMGHDWPDVLNGVADTIRFLD